MSEINLRDNYLDNAQKQAEQRGLYELPIVDSDCHYMLTPWEEISEYVEEPWRSRLLAGNRGSRHGIVPRDLGDRTVTGRMKSMLLAFEDGKKKSQEGKLPKDIYPLAKSSMKMGIDYNIIFPTDLLTLGMHPQIDHEVAISFAYNRWMTEKVLPMDESMKAMLYLPFSDPDACLRTIKEFGHKKGVVGFMITSLRYQPIYHNSYMPVFKAMEETGKPLGFHTVSNWMERPFQQFNRFLSAHALGFPLYNMIQMTNIIVNGLPERFPNLKYVFIEAGVSWIPFMMTRLDTDYLYRQSDAPLLTKKPSEYIKNFYFTTQPLEYTEHEGYMREVFDMIDAENQLLYASDYPHQDFDPPSSIYDLPFLSETAKRKILGENALKLFGIEQPTLWAKQRREKGVDL